MEHVGQKRIPSDAIVSAKKQKTSNGELVKRQDGKNELLPAGIRRTSNLQAPIMELAGHQGEVYTSKFSPDGNSLASGSFDKQIFFWDVYGECRNFNVLRGHKNAVLDLHWSTDSTNMYSVSADKTCAVWDLMTCTKRRTLREHTSIVNSCHPARRGPELLVTASDDGTIKMWDVREKKSIWTIKHRAAVTSVSFNDNASKIFSAGLDETIHCWDLQTKKLDFSMSGHSETITAISLSADGNFLVSNSMDNTVKVWDVKPFVMNNSPQGRCITTLTGVQHNYESNLLKCNWSPDGKRVVCGSADKFVYVWDVSSGNLLYRLPGHRGSVNEVAYHPKEPVIASCSSDKTIYLGEISE